MDDLRSYTSLTTVLDMSRCCHRARNVPRETTKSKLLAGSHSRQPSLGCTADSSAIVILRYARAVRSPSLPSSLDTKAVASFARVTLTLLKLETALEIRGVYTHGISQ